MALLIAAPVLGQTFSLIRLWRRLRFLQDIYFARHDAEALRIAGDTTQPMHSAAVRRFMERRRDRATSRPASPFSADGVGSTADVAAALEAMPRQTIGTPAESALSDSS